MTQGHGRGKWIFLSVLTLVAGGLGAFAIWAFAIRSDDAAPGEGPAAPLTQQERESLERFHVLATERGRRRPGDAISRRPAAR